MTIFETMKPMFPARKDALDHKPKHGQPCNGCGLCCMASLCPLGQHVFERPELPGPCPALEFKNGKSECGIVSLMTKIGHQDMADAAMLVIGADTGCDARFNGEPPDYSFYEKLKLWDKENSTKIDAALREWGMR